jgi:hypothetical protein
MLKSSSVSNVSKHKIIPLKYRLRKLNVAGALIPKWQQKKTETRKLIHFQTQNKTSESLEEKNQITDSTFGISIAIKYVRL